MSVHGSSVGGAGPSTATEETIGMEDPTRFWGDQLESRQGIIRIVYNNSNGLQIKEFLKNKTLQQSQRKHKKYLQDSTTNNKLTGFISLFRNWEAKIIALAETQTPTDKPKETKEIPTSLLIKNPIIIEIKCPKKIFLG